MQPNSRQIWAIVPAAGTGLRMAADRPKQYLELAGRTVISHSVKTLLDEPRIAVVAVGICADDALWSSAGLTGLQRLETYTGGIERAQTVCNGLTYLAQEHNAGPDDWVLVHDAVRPCLSAADLDSMIRFCEKSGHGGLLGCESVDTLKQVGRDMTVCGTPDRQSLWRALTPQMFRFELLRAALQRGLDSGVHYTDEAQAVEATGQPVTLVPGSATNIKITRPDDLELAAFFLSK